MSCLTICRRIVLFPLKVRSCVFSNRVVDVWNSLPNSVVTAPSLNLFKPRLNKHWHGHELKFNASCYIPGEIASVFKFCEMSKWVFRSCLAAWYDLGNGDLMLVLSKYIDRQFNSNSTICSDTSERWPENVRLFQPYQAEQITFPDYAACLSVKTFLHMCGLNFTTELRVNAEAMSPSGKVPFIQIGAFLISEMEPIIACVNTRGFQMSTALTDVQKSELKAYMSLIGNTLVNCELYLAWVDHAVANEVTKPRHGSMYKWPLSQIIPWQKQREVYQRLSSLGWTKKTFEEVCDEVHTCCQALSERLDRQEYFFGDKPTELDALVFGHLFTLLTTDLPNNEFGRIIERFSNLKNFCAKVDQKYFKDRNNDY